MRLSTNTITFKISAAFILSITVLALYLAISFKSNIKDTLADSERGKAKETVDTIVPIVELYLYLNQEEAAKQTLQRFAANGNIEAIKLYDISDKRIIYGFSRSTKEDGSLKPFILTRMLNDGMTGAPAWQFEVKYSSLFLQKLNSFADTQLRNVSIIVGIIFLFLLVSLLYLLAPLKQVANAIQNYKPGSKLELPKKAPSQEVGTIVDALQDMESKIREYERQLKDVNNYLELKVSEKTKELQDSNSKLEERVEEQTRQILESERILVQQSKLAAMGEMIGAIAHQWRQPLNALGIMVQDVKEERKYAGELSEEYLKDFEISAMSQVNFMSKTIDDFRNFFKPDKEKTLFHVHKMIKDSISIIEAQFKTADVELSFDGEDFACYGYPNEFSQVVLNLMSNAKDAILEKREREKSSEKGFIELKTSAENGFGVLKISDNGCGIPQEIVDKIFEPYFTTKEQGKGTGVGLYMSKLIVEKHIGGHLEVESSANGSLFIIKLTLGTESGNSVLL